MIPQLVKDDKNFIKEIELQNIKPNRTLRIIREITLKENEKIEDYDLIFIRDLNKFIIKANKHLYYLKIIMFFFIFYVAQFYNNIQIFILSFSIIFNIAFIQNMIFNLRLIKSN